MDAKIEALKRFSAQTQSIDDSQYGDFMRRLNLYLAQFERSLNGLGERATFSDIRMQLLFRPNFDIEATRRYVLEQARKVSGL